MKLPNQPSISDLETAIRDSITRPRMHDTLLANRKSWNVLHSALDVIGDTELALSSYLNWEYQADVGKKYLLVYGALQVMEVQQDAVRYLCESLAVRYSRPKELAQIRGIRSSAIGHPMHEKEERTIKSSFIRRSDLTQNRFTLRTMFSDQRNDLLRQVNIVELMDVQRIFWQKNCNLLWKNLGMKRCATVRSTKMIYFKIYSLKRSDTCSRRSTRCLTFRGLAYEKSEELSLGSGMR